MELTKGRNLIEHEQEIKSRPARTWFQTTAEKAVAKSKFFVSTVHTTCSLTHLITFQVLDWPSTTPSFPITRSDHRSRIVNPKCKIVPRMCVLSSLPCSFWILLRFLADFNRSVLLPHAMQNTKRLPFAGLSRKEKRRKIAAQDDIDDATDARGKNSKGSIDASVRSAKRSARPVKLTTAPAERVAIAKGKKKKAKNGFERELGVNGAKERERAAAESNGGGGGGGGGAKDKKSARGGSAGKPKTSFTNKRDAKAGKRS